MLDVLYAHGSGIDALVYAELFWPMFAEHRGMVVRTLEWSSGEQRELLDAALDRYRGDLTQAEQSVNWVDIGELFGPRKLESSADDDLALARLLQQMWVARLTQLFPDKQFAVQVIGGEETGGGPGISFWQL